VAKIPVHKVIFEDPETTSPWSSRWTSRFWLMGTILYKTKMCQNVMWKGYALT